MEKTYNFNLTLQQAQMVIFALKKQPMEQVENVVITMDKQFVEQVNADKNAVDALNAEAVTKTEDVQPSAPKPRKSRKNTAEAA